MSSEHGEHGNPGWMFMLNSPDVFRFDGTDTGLGIVGKQGRLCAQMVSQRKPTLRPVPVVY